MDKRLHIWVEINRRCVLTFPAPNKTFYEGQVVSLSRGGAMVELAGFAAPAIAIGTELEIEILLERSTNCAPRSICGRGRVVRAENAGESVRIAIQFQTVAFANARYYRAEQGSLGMVV